MTEAKRAAVQHSPHNLDAQDLTFKPEISELAKRMPSRSFHDRSIGDAQHMRERQISRVMHKEIAEQQSLSFKPTITTKGLQYPLGFSLILSYHLILTAAQSEGELRILSETDSLLHRIQEREQFKEFQRQLVLQQRERADTQDCSFKPAISQKSQVLATKVFEQPNRQTHRKQVITEEPPRFRFS